MVAVVGVDAELVDDLEIVFAPVLDVDERVGKRGAVVANKVVFLTKADGSFENVRGDEVGEQALELAVGESDAIERLKLLAEIAFERGAVAAVDVGKDFHVGDAARVGREDQRQRRGVVADLVDEDVRGGVVGVDAVDRQHGGAVGHRKGERAGGGGIGGADRAG